jgi:hypothetical protein
MRNAALALGVVLGIGTGVPAIAKAAQTTTSKQDWGVKKSQTEQKVEKHQVAGMRPSARGKDQPVREALTNEPKAKAAAVPAHIFTVNSLSDHGLAGDALAGTCVDDTDAKCTLRAAVEAANAATPGAVTVIQLGPGTYNLTGNSIRITNSLFIIGTDPATTVIDGDSVNGSVFSIGSYGPANEMKVYKKVPLDWTPAVEFAGLSIVNGGDEFGGAIDIGRAALTLSHTVIAHSGAFVGGGIYNSWNGSLWVFDSVLHSNDALFGGGLYNDGAAFIQNATIGDPTSTEHGNEAGAYGAGIYNDGSLVLRDTDIVGNFIEGQDLFDDDETEIDEEDATLAGVGMVNDAIMDMVGGTVSGNVGTLPDSKKEDGADGYGAGISNPGVATIADTVIANNKITGHGNGYGGGLWSGDQLTLTNATITGNLLTTDCKGCEIEGAGFLNDYTGAVHGGTISNNTARYVDRVYTDGVTTNEGTTLTSSSANFDSDDEGKTITGDGIPADTTIDTVTDEANVVLSKEATATDEDTTFTIFDRWGAEVRGVGVASFDVLSITGTTISGNTGDGGANEGKILGGGLYDDGSTLQVKDATISGNSIVTEDKAYGGGMFVDEHTVLDNVTVNGNSAEGDEYAEGGGISNGETLSASNVRITNNKATSKFGGVDGGGMFSAEVGQFDRLTVTGNAATAQDFVYGGGLSFEDDVSLTNSTLSGNTVTVTGNHALVQGGVLNTDDSINVVNTSFTGNTISAPNSSDSEEEGVFGGIVYTCCFATFTGVDISNNTVTSGFRTVGGAWLADSGTTVQRSTIAGNATATNVVGGWVAGTVFLDELTTWANSTLSNNTVKATASPGWALGGGVHVDGPSTFTNVTIAGNTALGTAGSTALVGERVLAAVVDADDTESGSGVFVSGQEGKATFQNSIVANNTPAAAACGIDEKRNVVLSAGFNIDSGNSCRFIGAADQENTDPQLLPLANNGGATPTQGLGPVSPARDSANPTVCPAIDQRGVSRPQGGGCDIGAFEAAVLRGYFEAATDGGVFAFGPDAHFVGSAVKEDLVGSIVGIAATPTGRGYWLVGEDGGVFAYGDAKYFGGLGGTDLNAPIIGIVATPDGKGYYLFAEDGGIFAYGNAPFLGSMGGIPLSQPILGMALDGDGVGYRLVSLEGGVFAFSAAFDKSLVGKATAPVLGIASDRGTGYWLLAADGKVTPFGGAADLGSAGGLPLRAPMIALAANGLRTGYYLSALDGGVFAYGDAPFLGSMAGAPLASPVVGLAAL